MAAKSKDHHIGNPPTHFRNPWPSFHPHGGLDLLRTRFGSSRNFVPVPDTREELVAVRQPTWGHDNSANGPKLKATWIGHASWLIETPAPENVTSDQKTGGLTILFDPVFSDRTSPFKWLGPKRYSPIPCSVADLPPVDVVIISHNHYDHLDSDTIAALHAKSAHTHYLCPLGNKSWFIGSGIPEDRVTELDWWDRVLVTNPRGDQTQVVCTPAQHTSARTPFDKDSTLWASWTVLALSTERILTNTSTATTITPLDGLPANEKPENISQRLFFAGDTGYRSVKSANPTPEEERDAPRCPAFKEIGQDLGPFDLALLPIGLYLPRNFMSSVHCAPEDSVCVHQDIRSKRSIGMHYGTFRGGLSREYEDVREPPRRWRSECEKAGLRWGVDADLCDIGETVVV